MSFTNKIAASKNGDVGEKQLKNAPFHLGRAIDKTNPYMAKYGAARAHMNYGLGSKGPDTVKTTTVSFAPNVARAIDESSLRPAMEYSQEYSIARLASSATSSNLLAENKWLLAPEISNSFGLGYTDVNGMMHYHTSCRTYEQVADILPSLSHVKVTINHDASKTLVPPMSAAHLSRIQEGYVDSIIRVTNPMTKMPFSLGSAKLRKMLMDGSLFSTPAGAEKHAELVTVCRIFGLGGIITDENMSSPITPEQSRRIGILTSLFKDPVKVEQGRYASANLIGRHKDIFLTDGEISKGPMSLDNTDHYKLIDDELARRQSGHKGRPLKYVDSMKKNRFGVTSHGLVDKAGNLVDQQGRVMDAASGECDFSASNGAFAARKNDPFAFTLSKQKRVNKKTGEIAYHCGPTNTVGMRDVRYAKNQQHYERGSKIKMNEVLGDIEKVHNWKTGAALTTLGKHRDQFEQQYPSYFYGEDRDQRKIFQIKGNRKLAQAYANGDVKSQSQINAEHF